MKENIIKNNCPPLGAHTSIAGGLFRALERGKQIGADAIQIFSKNQRQWHAPALNEEDIRKFKAARQATGISVPCIHTSYLINIAAPAEDTYRKSIQALADEVHRAAQLDVPFVVLHPGSVVSGTVEEGIDRVVAALNTVLASETGSGPTVLLETTAGQGTQLGRTLEELAEIIRRSAVPHRLGVCVDTCHVFAAGYAIHTATGWEAFKQQIEATIGMERVRVLHVNDSRMPLGSHRDRHARIGEGYIGLEGFRRIIQDPAVQHLPFILEIPGGEQAYAEDIQKLRQFCR